MQSKSNIPVGAFMQVVKSLGGQVVSVAMGAQRNGMTEVEVNLVFPTGDACDFIKEINRKSDPERGGSGEPVVGSEPLAADVAAEVSNIKNAAYVLARRAEEADSLGDVTEALFKFANTVTGKEAA